MTGHRRRFAATAAGSAALIAVLGGCAGGPGTSPAPSPTAPASPTASAAPTSPMAAPPGGRPMVPGGVTAAQAAQLCSDMQAQLQSWRTYTPTVGKTGLNTLVVEWAARNGINLFELAQDRGRIDAITSAQCPEVRDGALYALELSDLAAGLVGF